MNFFGNKKISSMSQLVSMLNILKNLMHVSCVNSKLGRDQSLTVFSFTHTSAKHIVTISGKTLHQLSPWKSGIKKLTFLG